MRQSKTIIVTGFYSDDDDGKPQRAFRARSGGLQATGRTEEEAVRNLTTFAVRQDKLQNILPDKQPGRV